MDIASSASVVRGNVEAIEQGLELIQVLTDEQYVCIVTPYVSSSIGQHFRHLVDLFLAIKKPFDEASEQNVQGSLIDYDERRRGAEIEQSRHVALQELNAIKVWLLELDQSFLEQTLQVKSEVTLNSTESVTLVTSVLRELVFTSSHAVHHFALINILAKLQNVTTDANLGVAPATASFLRAQERASESEAQKKELEI